MMLGFLVAAVSVDPELGKEKRTTKQSLSNIYLMFFFHVPSVLMMFLVPAV